MVQTITIGTRNRPSRQDLTELYEYEDSPCVSVFLPTHRAGPEISQDPIRLKNLLRQAFHQLSSDGMSPQEAEKFLAAGFELLQDQELWRHQEDGFALFLAPGFARSYRVPSSLPEQLVVGKSFHVTPLIPLLPQKDERFHILALSQERVRLFVGDQFHVAEIQADGIPQNLREVVGYDHEQKSLQFHTGTGAPAGGGRRRAMFHGHAAGDDAADDELLRFLHRVDDAVVQLLESPRPPMVLAAVERVAVAYKNVSHHGHLVDEIVEGNPDRASGESLHRQAWPVAEKQLGGPLEQARQRFEQLRHTDRGEERLAAIVADSVAGRVEVLFAREGEQRWGRFDQTSRKVTVDEGVDSAVDTAPSSTPTSKDRTGDAGEAEDLVGRAAMECLLHGGRVFMLPAEEFPGAGPLAAIYRY